MIKYIALVIIIFLSPPFIFAKPIITVMEFTHTSSKTKELALAMTNIARVDFQETGAYEIIDWYTMNNHLSWRDNGEAAPQAPPSYAQIRKFLGVQKIITGTISSLGRKYCITLSIIDARTGHVDYSVKEFCPCELESLDKAMSKSVQRLTAMSSMAWYPIESTREKIVRSSAPQLDRVASPHESGTITINALPWANIFLDGKDLDGTPISIPDVPVGTHTITLKHPEFLPIHKKIQVTSGQTIKIYHDFSSLVYGHLLVNAQPWGKVHVNGQYIGETPLMKKLPHGNYNILITNPQFKDRLFHIEIKSGQKTKIKAQFQ